MYIGICIKKQIGERYVLGQACKLLILSYKPARGRQDIRRRKFASRRAACLVHLRLRRQFHKDDYHELTSRTARAILLQSERGGGLL